jgi:membrane protein YdbS with pleckstrin-like domain
MSEFDYVSQRLEPQLEYYSKRAKRNKVFYFFFSTLSIILSIIIPFLAGKIDSLENRFISVIGLLALFLSVFNVLIYHFRFREKWIKYRTANESLKHQKFMYLAKVKPYNDNEAYKVLVEKVESLISIDNSVNLLEEKSK